MTSWRRCLLSLLPGAAVVVAGCAAAPVEPAAVGSTDVIFPGGESQAIAHAGRARALEMQGHWREAAAAWDQAVAAAPGSIALRQRRDALKAMLAAPVGESASPR